MRVASIDIGTNTILLLVADLDEQGTIHPIEHQQRLPRLGRDVDDKGVIHVSAFDRVVRILHEYKNLAIHLAANRIVAVATSAIRDAANKDEFVSYVKRTTGIGIEILSGEDEALCTYRGAVSGFPETGHRTAVVDIGGGSTEFSFPSPCEGNRNDKTAVEQQSFQIGCVRLSERFFRHNPPEPQEIENARGLITREFSRLKDLDLSEYSLIGVAGTATTLACLDQGLMEFEIEKVSGYTMECNRVGEWLVRLVALKTEEILSLSKTTEGRADILTAGVLILHEFMTQIRLKKIVVSERGLRYGLAIRAWANHTKEKALNEPR